MMLALGGLLGPQNALYTSTKRSTYVVFVAANNLVGRTCAACERL